MRIRYFLLGLFLLIASGVSAETLYVNTPSADLKSSIDATATILTTLSRGTALTVKSKSGNWVQGTTATGKLGWVYKFKLSTTKPTSGSSGLLAGLGGGGATAKEGSTATSIRGLSPTSEKYAGRAKIKPAHIKMIKEIESVQVSKSEIDTFLKDGKLGEYAQ